MLFRSKPARAGAQFMNIMINGDDIQAKVTANYPAVANFYGDGGAMLEGLAVANIYPPREANPDFPFSLKNNMISYMPDRDSLKDFQIEGTKPAQSEIQAYCVTIENRITVTSPNAESYQTAIDTAGATFKNNVKGDITSIGHALVNYGVNNAMNDIFLATAPSILSSLGLGGTALMSFIPVIGQIAQVLAVASLVHSVIDWLGDLLNPQPTEIENAINDLYSKMAAMDQRLTTLENTVAEMDSRLQTASLQIQQMYSNYFLMVRNQLNTWRSELTQKMNLFHQYHSPSDLNAFITSATAIDKDITALINN